jgi:ubiquinone/menaquinone biosynthesis C-methylase UbiE
MNQAQAIQPDTFEAFEYLGWEKLSSQYHERWGHVTGDFAPGLVRAAGALEGKQVLDIATGPGYAARLARNEGAQVIGLDFSPQMVDQASRLNPDIRFVCGDVHALPFEDQRFDYVVSNFGAQHFAHLDLAFAQIARVLKPGGKCAFTLWADNDLNHAGKILDEATERYAEGPTSVPQGPNYHELCDDQARINFLTRAGFVQTSLVTRRLDVEWTLVNQHELFEAELAGSVRSGARLREQQPAPLQRIRKAMAERILRDYQVGGELRIPMAAYVITGTRA